MSPEQPAASDASDASDDVLASHGQGETPGEGVASPPAHSGDVGYARGQDTANYQALADGLLANLGDGRGPEDTALALAVLAHRAATRLHSLTRAEAGARKQQPDWPAWAQLQNASRTLLLQASTCRDLAARLAGRRQ